MVNLLKFRKKALSPEESSFGDDPLAANDRYNRAIIPLLLKHGGHPVFLGQVRGGVSAVRRLNRRKHARQVEQKVE